MRRLLASSFILAPLLSSAAAGAASPVLISELRTRGPNGANDEFIELFNASGAAVNISSYSVRASDGSGNTALLKQIPANTVLAPRHFYLLANSASQGYSGSTAPNATYTVGVPDNGGIALLNAGSIVIDAVGMSSGSAYKEGTPLAPLVANVNQSYERNSGGCTATQDTDDNATDFRLNGSGSGPQNSTFNCNSCAGVVCNSPPNFDCYVSPGTCTAGTCNYAARAAGTSCSDGDACTVGDKCDSTQTCVSGTPAACTTPPASFCSSPQTLVSFASVGTCSSLAGCVYTPSSQTCQFGCNGTTKQCNPDPCTSVSCNTPPNDCFQTSGTCTGGTCTYSPKAANTACDDGNACTSGEKCNGGGTCGGGAATPVDDANPCTIDACNAATGQVTHKSVPDGTGCDDGNLCNGVATCQAGACVNGAPVACVTPPIGGCYATTGVCNPANGSCTYQPRAPGSACDDGNACTTSDQCDGNGACAGSAVVCAPGAPTCVDPSTSRTFSAGVCQAGSGSCSVVSADKSCAFGCNAASGLCNSDPCIGVTCSSPPSQCHDAQGTCSNGSCSYSLTPDAACDDGDPCTSNDKCSAAGACAGTPLACNTPPLPTCKDASTSTKPDVTGTCSAGGCSYALTDEHCDFGCDAISGQCKGPCAGITCDQPPDQCHQAIGTCTAGSCSYELKPSGSTCDDGDPCTVSDICSAAGTCAGQAKSCNAPPSPTCNGAVSHAFAAAGTCDSTGACSYAATDTTCAAGCSGTTGLCNDDPCAGVTCASPPGACSLDLGTCSGGKCSYAARTAGVACDDNDACTTSDACDGNGSCVGVTITGCAADGGTSAGGAGGQATSGAGGASAGGAASTGGAGAGGATGASGATASGGSVAGSSGGAPAAGGGSSDTGGALADAGVGLSGAAGTAGFSSGSDNGGCGCTVPRSTSTTTWPFGLLALSALALRRRRR